jgi:RimJ/RimL family protein N-acetyltransferase
LSISLRPVSSEDLATIDRWASGVGSSEFMSRTRPIADHADHHDPGSGLFWYLVIQGSREVGTVWIERLSGEGKANLGVFLGSASDLGHGIGAAAIRLAIAQFHQAFPGEPICLNVRRSNARALGCFRSLGFVIDGAGTKVPPSGDRIPFYSMVWSPHELAGDPRVV